MFNRLKSAVIGAVSGIEQNSLTTTNDHLQQKPLVPKFSYTRPQFLALSNDELQMSADHKLRPIIHPSQPLPYFTGYAECVNAGKSRWNEDQAVYRQGVLTRVEYNDTSGIQKFSIPYTYYGIFDGHAGVGAALCAANQLHHILHEKLVDAQDDIWIDFSEKKNYRSKPSDLLITGALEAAFKEMDEVIAEDRTKYQAAGGCTALVALFILDKLFIANAGDSRAGICNSNNKFIQMSMDFTPESERDRIRRLAEEQPLLLGKEFTSKEYIKQPKSSELGKTIMYRDAHMNGWAYKTLQAEDLKLSVITGQGKRSRVMGTIGVTRGFGDHDLLSIYQKTPIKPFLSCHPEVQMYRLKNVINEKDVLIMGTDGLWDVINGTKATEVVQKSINAFMEKERYVSAATCLVGVARGSLIVDHMWVLKDGKPASSDDISVFVIPLLPYKIEYEKLVEKYLHNSEK